MTALDLAVKTCTKCGEEKPLSGFYRDKKSPDGRSTWCGDCNRSAVKERNAARREEMGEEAWLAYRREAVRRARSPGNTQDSAQSAAYRAAEVRVREAHRSEFDRYYQEERYERGLD